MRGMGKGQMTDRDATGQESAPTKKAKTRRRRKKKRSTRDMIFRRVEMAVPMMLGGASKQAIQDATHKATGRALDGNIINQLRRGRYESWGHVWVLDFENKTYTSPFKNRSLAPAQAYSSAAPHNDAASIEDIALRFYKDLEARGFTDICIDKDGTLTATQSVVVKRPR